MKLWWLPLDAVWWSILPLPTQVPATHDRSSLVMITYTNCIPILDGWSLLHFFSQGPAFFFFYLPCPRPKTCDLPGMFDHVSHLLALHLAARSRLRRLKRGNTDLRDICCKCPKKLLRWPWKEVSSILRQTHHSCCWQYTFCIYIYYTYYTHTSYPIIYPLFAIISPLHPLQNG